MSDSEVISLSLCQETLGIDSENFFFGASFQMTTIKNFPTLFISHVII
jgi:hypothetical protein